MAQIFNQAKDKNVAAVLVYVKASDVHAYADAGYTTKIPCAELKDMFEKGCIVVDAAVEYAPTSFAVASGVGSLTYVKSGASNAATLTVIKSSEAV